MLKEALEFEALLFNQALRSTNNKEQAEDLVQTFFLKLLEKPVKIDMDKGYITYMKNKFNWLLVNNNRNTTRELLKMDAWHKLQPEFYTLEDRISFRQLLIARLKAPKSLSKTQTWAAEYAIKGYEADDAAAEAGISLDAAHERYKYLRKDLKNFIKYCEQKRLNKKTKFIKGGVK